VGWGVTQLLDKGADTLAEAPTIRVSLESDPARVYARDDPEWQTYGFVRTGSVADLGSPPTSRCREWRRWAIPAGGVDADQTRLYAFLQGRPDTAVVITGVDVEIVARRPPIVGTHAYCPAPGGATASPRLVDIDLDFKPPRIRFAEIGDDYPQRRRLLLTLTGPETETLELSAHTRRCDCSWRARVYLVVDGEPSEVLLDDGGRPFRTSASGRARHVTWDGRGWVPLSRSDWKRSLPMRWHELDP
jgi:hypothetical protein